MCFGRRQTAQRSRFFPCNAMDIVLKLSIVWRGPNHDFRAFGRGHDPVAPSCIRPCGEDVWVTEDAGRHDGGVIFRINAPRRTIDGVTRRWPRVTTTFETTRSKPSWCRMSVLDVAVINNVTSTGRFIGFIGQQIAQ